MTAGVPLGLGLSPVHIEDVVFRTVAAPPAALVLVSSEAAATLPPAPLRLPPPPDPRNPADHADPILGDVISRFGWRDGARHEGIDIKGASRAPITASFPGRVIQAGQGATGYGLSVTIDHGDGVTTLYAHLQSVTVRAGDVVESGRQVGVQGQTGRASGPHLHYEVRINGRPVDPMPYLAD